MVQSEGMRNRVTHIAEEGQADKRVNKPQGIPAVQQPDKQGYKSDNKRYGRDAHAKKAAPVDHIVYSVRFPEGRRVDYPAVYERKIRNGNQNLDPAGRFNRRHAPARFRDVTVRVGIAHGVFVKAVYIERIR
jgi:hypothetical protein